MSWFSTWRRSSELAGLGSLAPKEPTGTQPAFLELFGGDDAKVLELDRRVAAAFGFAASYPVSGQTYSRKVDAQVLWALSGLAEASIALAATWSLLAHERELEEPFESDQIGSSAMAYKRNPMRAERMCSLARFALALAPAASQTAATQWLERTLDDSAIRRLVDSRPSWPPTRSLTCISMIIPRLVVHRAVIERHVSLELPFMATENLLDGGRSSRRRPPRPAISASGCTRWRRLSN